MNHKFAELFQEFGYTVEQVGEESFLADNGVFCVPYTEYHRNGIPKISAVTFDSCHKEELKALFTNEKQIGYAVWREYINARLEFPTYGFIATNHDCMFCEVRSALESMAEHGLKDKKDLLYPFLTNKDPMTSLSYKPLS